MKKYSVVLTRSAEKSLARLPNSITKSIVTLLESLQNNPRPTGCKKLKGYKNLWRIRFGDYRIIYAIEEVILLVDVREIGHRKDIYDQL
ncbi:MAG: type II toxin-antitoxin system RelE/ParE family toxin [Chitinophagaceae bacterium]|nr:type II toxin-antitoxin system RelE/ParE family toxin [Chitinophagaceae bacterium]